MSARLSNAHQQRAGGDQNVISTFGARLRAHKVPLEAKGHCVRLSPLEAKLATSNANVNSIPLGDMEIHRGAGRNEILQSLLGSSDEDLKKDKVARSTTTSVQEATEKKKAMLAKTLSSTQRLAQRYKSSLEISEKSRTEQEEDLKARTAMHETELQTARQCLSEQSSKVTALEASLIETDLALTKLQAEVRRLQGIDSQQVAMVDPPQREINHVESVTSQGRRVNSRRESHERCLRASSNLQMSGADVAAFEPKAARQNAEVNSLNKEVRGPAAGGEIMVSEYEERLRTLVARFRGREKLSEVESKVIRELFQLKDVAHSKEVNIYLNKIKGHSTTNKRLTTRVSQLETLLEGRLKGDDVGNVRNVESSPRSSSIEILSPPPAVPQQEAGQRAWHRRSSLSLPPASPHPPVTRYKGNTSSQSVRIDQR